MELDVVSVIGGGSRCSGSSDCPNAAVVCIRGVDGVLMLCEKHARRMLGLVNTSLDQADPDGHYFVPTREHPRPEDVVRFEISFRETRNPRSRISEFTRLFNEYLEREGIETMSEANLAVIGGSMFRTGGVVTADALLRLERWIRKQRIRCHVQIGHAEDGLLVDYNREIDPRSEFNVDNLTTEDLAELETQDL